MSDRTSAGGFPRLPLSEEEFRSRVAAIARKNQEYEVLVAHDAYQRAQIKSFQAMEKEWTVEVLAKDGETFATLLQAMHTRDSLYALADLLRRRSEALAQMAIDVHRLAGT